MTLAFPRTKITHDSNKPPDLVIRSHFLDLESTEYDCPYITWSGESYSVKPRKGSQPLLALETAYSDDKNSIYFPYICFESSATKPQSFTSKKYCCAFAFSNPVLSRERVFLSLRRIEPLCYSFGKSCYTNDNPYELPNRHTNRETFRDFAFSIAMENVQKPGYITEKIGFAFESGTVPIYNSNNGVDRFFNRESFFDIDSYASNDAVAEAVVQIWKDTQKLQKYLDAPAIINDNLSQYQNLDQVTADEPRAWMVPFIDCLRQTFKDH